MPTPTSPRQDVPTSSMPMPHPTHPVAGQSVTEDAPTFDWTPVPGAEAYRLQLAASDDFEMIYYDETVDGPTSVSLADRLPADATEGVWRVRAKTGPESPWSTPAHFEVDGDAVPDVQFRVDAPPVPVHPIDGDVVDAHAAAFTWEAVPEASGYRLQVGRSESFDDPLLDRTFDQVTSITLFDLLPAEQSTLFWRVRAVFPNDTEGPWSETAVFGTDPESEEEPVEPMGDPDAPVDDAPDPKHSPIAAGPAEQGRTSSTMAIVLVGVLVVSFLATLVLILWTL